MRVANRTVYDTITFNLGNITEALYKANKVVATGKRINSLSDDPVGLTQCLAIRSSLANLEQLEKNIATGRTWLNAGEAALDSINDLISDTKVLCVQMANGSMNATDRAEAAGLVDGYLRQILSLANTEVNGQYIFAGTKTDTRPLDFDDEANPTKVSYSGNDSPFTVKIGKDATVAVGRDGEEVFWDEIITVDETNNKIDFEEDLGKGPDFLRTLTATIPSGTYTASELGIAIENAMNEISEDSGYDITYEVSYDASTKKFTIKDDGTYPGFLGFQLLWESGENAGTSLAPDIGFDAADVTHAPLTSDNEVRPITITAGMNDMIDFEEDSGAGFGGELNAAIPPGDYAEEDLAAAVEEAIESASLASGNGIDYQVSFNSITNKFTINCTGLTNLWLRWGTGSSGNSAGPTLGFTVGNVLGPPPTHTGDTAVEAISITAGDNTIDFKERPNGGILSGELNVTLTPGDYSTADLASEIETQMTAESAASGNNIVYAVSYDSTTGKFTIKENGTTLDELQLLWDTGTNSGTSAASKLGFDDEDDIVTPLISDSEVEWGIFKTLMDLKAYLEANDVDGIQRSITRLDTHFNNFSSTISDTGFKEIRLDIKEQVISDLNLSYLTRKSKLEDADIIEAIMELQAKEAAYQAALASSAKVMQLSLVDYL